MVSIPARLWVGSVKALDRVFLLDGTSGEAKALISSSRVGNNVQPDRVAAIKRRLASLEADLLTSLVPEDEVAVVVDGEGSPLSVPDHALRASGVLDNTLTHAGPVNEQLLGRVGSVEVEGAVVELEGSVVVGLRAASGVLFACVDHQRVLDSFPSVVL